MLTLGPIVRISLLVAKMIHPGCREKRQEPSFRNRRDRKAARQTEAVVQLVEQ